MTAGFTIKFWGVRGTVPCPGTETARYGGNTACVEVRAGGRLLIFDAGSGLRLLGKQLRASGEHVRAHLFLSHTHLDHILGLPFFKPVYFGGNCLELWSGHLRAQGKQLEEVLGRVMEKPLFPVPLDLLLPCIKFRDFTAGETLDVDDGVQLRTAALHHPGGATGYRLEFAGRSFCYVTDTEHRPGHLDGAILELIAGSDVVVYDTTYTDEEFHRHGGWGHSTWQEGVRLCEAADAKRLVAFHHDPEHDDIRLDAIQRELGLALPGSLVAREGLVIEL